jgi:prepilin-type N-terminal cleavage/methylation domain-containing protein
MTRKPTPASAPRGFSLIELMIVVSIIGVLASLAMVAWRKSVIKARESKVTEFFAQVAAAQEQYRNMRGAYAASAGWCPTRVPEGKTEPLARTCDPVFGALGINPPDQTYFTFILQSGTPTTNCAKPAGVGGASFGAVDMCQKLTAGSFWWQSVAVGNQDDDNRFSTFVQTSGMNGVIYTVNSGE